MTAPDSAADRSRGVRHGTITAMIARGVSALTGIVSVPLTIGYLGSERYGIWVTIGTFLAFLSFTDFGIANTLNNVLGKAFGEERREVAARYVSSAFLLFCAIAALLLLAIFFGAAPLAHLLFPKVQTPLARAEITPALALAFVVFALNFPLLVNNKVLATHRENAIANLWAIAGSVANLGAILLVLQLRGGLPWLVLGCSGLGLLMNIACAIWLFGFHKPWLRPAARNFDRAIVRELLATGWKFFVISSVWMINSETDNLVIAHYLGAAQVTPYSVTFYLFANATLLQILAYPSLWPAYAEAYAQRDFGWIRKTFRRQLHLSIFVSAALVTLFTIFGRAIIRLWAGDAAVPTLATMIWMALWNLMLANLYVSSCLLNATGHLRGMTIYGIVTAILNLLLSIALVQIFGVAGVIAGTVISFAFANYLPTFLEARRVLRDFEKVSA